MPATPRLKIAYITPALYSAGGMERVVVAKANYFAEHYGHDVTVIVTEGPRDKTFFPLSPKVSVVNLGLDFEELWNRPFLTKVGLYLRKQLLYRRRLRATLTALRPDIAISTLRREINFLTAIGDGSLKIGELHLSRHSYRASDSSDAPTLLKRLFYRWWQHDVVSHLCRLDHFVVLTEQALREWPEIGRISVIPDPLTFSVSSTADVAARRVVAVGRYSYEKGYDLLLAAWAAVEDRHPDWHLDVYGMGDPTPYARLMAELSIDKERCHLNASLVDVRRAYLRSAILVQPSRSEGFGLAMVEAMACALPVVAFDCENGPRAIVTDGTDGFLVPAFDVTAFASRLSQLMDDPALRADMGRQGRLKSARYDIGHIAGQWQQLFEALLRHDPV